MTTTFEGSVVAIVAIAVVGFALLVLIFRAIWRVAEPNEALIISGLDHKAHEETATCSASRS